MRFLENVNYFKDQIVASSWAISLGDQLGSATSFGVFAKASVREACAAELAII